MKSIPRCLEADAARLFAAAGYTEVELFRGEESVGVVPVAQMLKPDFRLMEDDSYPADFHKFASTDGQLVWLGDQQWWNLFGCGQCFSILLGNQATLSQALEAVPLEGFYCDETTTERWFRQGK
jgi:hypothetical protein